MAEQRQPKDVSLILSFSLVVFFLFFWTKGRRESGRRTKRTAPFLMLNTMVFLCYIFIVIVFDIVVTFYTLFNIENDSLLVVKKIFSAFFFFSSFFCMCVLPPLSPLVAIIIIFIEQFLKFLFSLLFFLLFSKESVSLVEKKKFSSFCNLTMKKRKKRRKKSRKPFYEQFKNSVQSFYFVDERMKKLCHFMKENWKFVVDRWRKLHVFISFSFFLFSFSPPFAQFHCFDIHQKNNDVKINSLMILLGN